MIAIRIEADGRDWDFLAEEGLRPSDRMQAIISAQLRDELTGLPPAGPVMVSTASPGVTPKASAGARIGLSGRPSALFPEPWPAPAPRVQLMARADQHLPIEIDTELGAQPDMPAIYALLDLGPVDIHRAPTRLSGRIISRSLGPSAAANVAVTTMWQAFSDIGGPGIGPDALSIWTGLYADRPVGAVVRRRTLNLLGTAKQLLRPISEGDTQIRLSDRQGLLVGRPIAIEPGDVERQEYIVVTAIDTASSDDQPAFISLAHPARRSHPNHVPVSRTGFAVPGADNHLVRSARRGDVSLFLDGLLGITAANTIIEIAGGGPEPEYHGFALWRAVTAADGSFRLPPIHRVAHLEISGPPAADPIRVSLNAPGDALADILFD